MAQIPPPAPPARTAGTQSVIRRLLQLVRGVNAAVFRQPAPKWAVDGIAAPRARRAWAWATRQPQAHFAHLARTSLFTCRRLAQFDNPVDTILYPAFPFCRCDHDTIYNPLRLGYYGENFTPNGGLALNFYFTTVPVPQAPPGDACAYSDVGKLEFNVGEQRSTGPVNPMSPPTAAYQGCSMQHAGNHNTSHIRQNFISDDNSTSSIK